MAPTTPPVSRRRPHRRGTQTRARALDAVLALVAEHGPSGVTFRAVAGRSGVALGALSYHFPSRDALLSSAFEHHLARLRHEAAALPVDAIAQLDDGARVDAVMAFLTDMATVQRERYLAEFELALESARNPELRAATADARAVTHTMATELLDRAGSSDPVADATVFSAAMEGLLLGLLAQPDDPAVRSRTEAAVRRLVTTLLG